MYYLPAAFYQLLSLRRKRINKGEANIKMRLQVMNAADKEEHRLQHVPELDGLRGFAALIVFMHHAAFTNLDRKALPTWSLPVQVLYRCAAFGSVGVDVFFILSGFLITTTLIESRSNKRFYQDFYWKRALRILPLYVVCLLGVLVIRQEVGYVVLASLFLVNFASVVHVQGLGPFWTLAIEEQFYVLWPTVVKRLSTELLLWTSVCFGLLSVALRLLFAHQGHHNYYLSILRFDGLAFGSGLACVYKQNLRLGGHRPVIVFLWSSIILGSSLLLWSKQASSQAYAAAEFQTGVILVSGGVVGLTLFFSGSSVLWIMRSRLIVTLGLLSYAFYMVHLYVLTTWDHFVGLPALGASRMYLTRIVVCFIVSIVLAVGSRYLIELPAMRLRKYVLTPHAGERRAT